MKKIYLVLIFSTILIGCNQENNVIDATPTPIEKITAYPNFIPTNTPTPTPIENLFENVPVAPEDNNSHNINNNFGNFVDIYQTPYPNQPTPTLIPINTPSPIPTNTPKPTATSIPSPTPKPTNTIIPTIFPSITPTEKYEILYKSNQYNSPQNFNLNKTLKHKNLSNFLKLENFKIEENTILFYKNDTPLLELYIDKTNDCYTISMYCILNEEIDKKNREQIKENNYVLKQFLYLFTNNADVLYNTLYNDYEINSIITEEYKKYNDFYIKADVMPKYVIYYIKK